MDAKELGNTVGRDLHDSRSIYRIAPNFQQ